MPIRELKKINHILAVILHIFQMNHCITLFGLQLCRRLTILRQGSERRIHQSATEPLA